METVDLGDAKFLLGALIHPHVTAGTKTLSQEAYSRTTMETYGMATAADATNTPAKQRPVRIKEEELLSTGDTTIAYSVLLTGYLPYLS